MHSFGYISLHYVSEGGLSGCVLLQKRRQDQAFDIGPHGIVSLITAIPSEGNNG
jgi:hypothetical protein